ncbi:malonyl-CoA decarboxylase [Haliea sp. E17]|uniref:malonyl-CoA decarboxylase n=1 Tax=Haliea sp. E17 TaxID=3401576 RepID=UPI003AAC1BF7
MSSEQSLSDNQEVAPAATTRPLARILGSVMDVGRVILNRRGLISSPGIAPEKALLEECRELLHHRGEASGLALALDILNKYQKAGEEDRLAFFRALAKDYEPDALELREAAKAYAGDPSRKHFQNLSKAMESPRQKLFRRLNMAPGGTGILVKMREQMLDLENDHPELKPVSHDLRQLFVSWFNKGFLELRHIDWSAPALELEKIIAYEAVHEINGWDDLRSRLRDDRRCFAFFHPAMEHDPLVFVEVALTDQVPGAIAPLLDQNRDMLPSNKANTVVFYSISNCHRGLAGVSFGNFLIKSVVGELKQEMPWLKQFVTLSPIPGFRRWLQKADISELVSGNMEEKVRAPIGRVVESEIKEALMKLCAHYLVEEKAGTLAKDPVARFHLGNGARLHRLHWGADLTSKGRDQSAGMMVNYLYDLDRIEENHEAYFDQGTISVSRTITSLLN